MAKTRTSPLFALVALVAIGVSFFAYHKTAQQSSRLSQVTNHPSATAITPIVTSFLQEKGLLSSTGEVTVPGNASSNSGGGSTGAVTTETVTDLVNQLLKDNVANYITSYIDANGALQGPTGPQGPAGANGNGSSVAAGDGLILSGGTLSLKPCALNQLLVMGATNWDCSTVSGGGTDINTTNTSASISYTNKTITFSVHDSDGNVVTSNIVDLSGDFADKTGTATSLTTLTNNLSALSTTVGGKASQTDLNSLGTTVSGKASQADLTSLSSTVSGISSGLSNYVTNSTLGTTLANYVTATSLASTLGSYVSSSSLAVTLGDYAQTSDLSDFLTADDLTTYATKTYVDDAVSGVDLSGYATKTYVDNAVGDIDLSNYVTTTALGAALDDYALASDLTGYATTGDVSVALSTAEGYADSAVAGIDLSGYATGSDISDAIAAIDYSGFATTGDIDDLQGQIDDLSGGSGVTAGTGITIDGAQVSVTNYANLATKTYADTAASTATTGLASTSSVTSAIASAVTGLASESYVDSAITGLGIDDYAKTTDVTSAIATAVGDLASTDYVDSAIGDIDLSGYVTTGDLSAALDDYATVSSLGSYVTAVSLASSLGSYVTNTSLTSTLGSYVTSSSLSTTLGGYVTTVALGTATSGLASESYVDDAIAGIDFSAYATAGDIADLQGQIDDLSGGSGVTAGTGITIDGAEVSVTGYDDLATKTYADGAASTAQSAAEDYVDTAVSGLATTDYVDDAISGLDFATPDDITTAVTGLASEGYVDTAVAGLAAVIIAPTSGSNTLSFGTTGLLFSTAGANHSTNVGDVKILYGSGVNNIDMGGIINIGNTMTSGTHTNGVQLTYTGLGSTYTSGLVINSTNGTSLRYNGNNKLVVSTDGVAVTGNLTVGGNEVATEDYVDTAIDGLDFATTGDVSTAVSGLASEAYVDDAIAGIDFSSYATTADLSDYVAIADLGSLTDNIATGGSLYVGGGITSAGWLTTTGGLTVTNTAGTHSASFNYNSDTDDMSLTNTYGTVTLATGDGEGGYGGTLLTIGSGSDGVTINTNFTVDGGTTTSYLTTTGLSTSVSSGAAFYATAGTNSLSVTDDNVYINGNTALTGNLNLGENAITFQNSGGDVQDTLAELGDGLYLNGELVATTNYVDDAIDGITGSWLSAADLASLGSQTITTTGAVNTGALTVTGAVLASIINNSTGVSLQYNGATKLATTSTGISVTGTLDATNLTIGGSDVATKSYVDSTTLSHTGTVTYPVTATTWPTVASAITSYGTPSAVYPSGASVIGSLSSGVFKVASEGVYTITVGAYSDTNQRLMMSISVNGSNSKSNMNGYFVNLTRTVHLTPTDSVLIQDYAGTSASTLSNGTVTFTKLY